MRTRTQKDLLNNRLSHRRDFLRCLGVSSAALPFVCNLPSLGFAGAPGSATPRKQRLVILFSPNGVVPPTFWPDEEGRRGSRSVKRSWVNPCVAGRLIADDGALDVFQMWDVIGPGRPGRPDISPNSIELTAFGHLLTCDGISRRRLIQAGGAGLLGLNLPKVLAAENQQPFANGRAKSVIFLFLFGGPSQLETFDMKPEAPDQIRGPFKPIASRTPGLRAQRRRAFHRSAAAGGRRPPAAGAPRRTRRRGRRHGGLDR